MRTVELAKTAAQAETLRLRQLAIRQGWRAGYYVGAAVFAIGVLIMLHIIAYNAMVPRLSPVAASTVLLLVNLVIAGIFWFLAGRNTPSLIEQEARVIRDRSLAEMRSSLTLASLVLPASRFMGKRRTTGLALGALATRLLARRS